MWPLGELSVWKDLIIREPCSFEVSQTIKYQTPFDLKKAEISEFSWDEISLQVFEALPL